MSWTTPVTWVPNYLVGATDLNAQIRDNLLVLVAPLDTSTGKVLNYSSNIFLSVAGFIRYNASSVTPGSNSGAGETDLISATLSANALATDGYSIRYTSWGTITNSANAKIIKQYFGVSLHGYSGMTSTGSAQSWWYQSIIARTGAAAQTAVTSFHCGVAAGQLNMQTDTASPGQTLSGTVTIKTTGQGGASNEITALGHSLEILRNLS